MYRRITALIVLWALMLCGCEKNVSSGDVSDIILSETPAESFTEAKTGYPAELEAVSITFAKAETEEVTEKTTRSETEMPEQTETERVLADNQLEYSTSTMYILMEFTGVDELGYYPQARNYRLEHLKDDRVLHSSIRVTNLADKSFDFIPRAMIMYGRVKDRGGYMSPATKKDTGLKTAETYYTIEPGETVSFDIDFVGDKECVESPYEIKYTSDLVKVDGVKNAAYGNFDMTKRTAIKKAINAAMDTREDEQGTVKKLEPREGEYSVNTPKNSYCFTIEPLDNGRYVKVAMRLQCLTGEPEQFEAHRFILNEAAGQHQHHNSASCWSFDPVLTNSTPKVSKSEINGVSGTLYDTPFYLFVRPDGSAEYTMYFFTANDDLSNYYMFSYESDNDVFECMISIE